MMSKKDAKDSKDSKDSKTHKGSKHHKAGDPDLPGTREALLPLHEAARQRRNAAKLGGESWTEASMEVARIEVEIARLERAMDPPAG
jgi:hypothetical protein